MIQTAAEITRRYFGRKIVIVSEKIRFVALAMSIPQKLTDTETKPLTQISRQVLVLILGRTNGVETGQEKRGVERVADNKPSGDRITLRNSLRLSASAPPQFQPHGFGLEPV